MYIRSALIVLALALSMPALAQTAGNTPNTGPQGRATLSLDAQRIPEIQSRVCLEG
jgi:hypothetical protein